MYAFKRSMTEELSMAHMLMYILMTLTLVQGHSGSAKAAESALNHLDN